MIYFLILLTCTLLISFPIFHSLIQKRDFTLLFIIEGSGSLNGQDVKAEEIYALAPGEEIKAHGNFSMMKIVPQKRSKKH